MGGFDSKIRVFVDSTLRWFNADLTGDFEKHVGFGLVSLGVFGSNDRIKETAKPNMLQDLKHNRMIGSRPDAHLFGVAILASDLDDRLDRLDLMKDIEKRGFFFTRDRFWITANPLLFQKNFDDMQRRLASHGIKSVFAKLNSVLIESIAPRNEVQWHRIGEGAVAIKNQSVGGLDQFDIVAWLIRFARLRIHFVLNLRCQSIAASNPR